MIINCVNYIISRHKRGSCRTCSSVIGGTFCILGIKAAIKSIHCTDITAPQKPTTTNINPWPTDTDRFKEVPAIKIISDRKRSTYKGKDNTHNQSETHMGYSQFRFCASSSLAGSTVVLCLGLPLVRFSFWKRTINSLKSDKFSWNWCLPLYVIDSFRVSSLPLLRLLMYSPGVTPICQTETFLCTYQTNLRSIWLYACLPACQTHLSSFSSSATTYKAWCPFYLIASTWRGAYSEPIYFRLLHFKLSVIGEDPCLSLL